MRVRVRVRVRFRFRVRVRVPGPGRLGLGHGSDVGFHVVIIVTDLFGVVIKVRARVRVVVIIITDLFGVVVWFSQAIAVMCGLGSWLGFELELGSGRL